MHEYYQRVLLRHLQGEGYTPCKLSRIARDLGIEPADRTRFEAAFDALRAAGQVIVQGGDRVSLRPLGNQVVGTFRANPRGFGFISPQDPSEAGDLYVAEKDRGDAMTGDLVVANVRRRRGQGGVQRVSGRVASVLRRAHSRIVGVLEQRGDTWQVQPDGAAGLGPVEIADMSARRAGSRDKVVVEIVTYPSESRPAQGAILAVLGRTGRYDTEIAATIERFHLPTSFPPPCLDRARAAIDAFASGDKGAQREDLGALTVITIDPPDAKDFDDAISLTRNAQGAWVLGVHIADASHFVAPDTELDREAAARGNSVYLPGRTLPMLPESLSNGLCSLQPGQERLTKSVFLTYDEQGRIRHRRFANTRIRSTRRLTYLEADAALRGRVKGLGESVCSLLGDLERLSRLIEARRHAAGMLHLDLPETELDFDAAGRVAGAHPAETSYPHTMIEMFMVEANEAVAGLLDRHQIPFLRRIHPAPDPATLQRLVQLVRVFGYHLGRRPDRRALQDLLAAVRGQDCELAVNLSVLRSLAKAEYAPLQIGHYALAGSCYCHFTSPIRRYADLLVHRQLQYVLDGRIQAAHQTAAAQDLKAMGRHLTAREQAAEEAEQDLKTVLILQHLTGRLGEELQGVVTGLANFGVFVQCRPYGIEGLVRTVDLGDDHWDYQARGHCVTGRRTGRTLTLGQALTVRIASINVAGRYLNLVPAQALAAAPRRRQRPGPRETRGSGRRGRGRRR